MRKNFYNTFRFLLLLIPAVVGLSLVGCKTTTEYVAVPQACDCPRPVDRGNGYRYPRSYFRGQRVSPDRKILFFVFGAGTGSINLLHLQDLSVETISLKQILPDTAYWVDANCASALWCPYDPNKLLIFSNAFFDTTGSGAYNYFKENIYIYNVLTKEVKKVTPPGYGKFGASTQIGLLEWLEGSTENSDSLRIRNNKIYVPQENKYYPYSYPTDDYHISSLSTDNVFTAQSLGTSYLQMFINNHSLSFNKYIGSLDNVSWSPNGEKIAFEIKPAFPSTDTLLTPSFAEVWIFDAKTFINFGYENIYRLNFQDLFCKYSLNGISPEYITDSTLAVSMHKDGDNISPLWEITDKGRIIRQLTK